MIKGERPSEDELLTCTLAIFPGSNYGTYEDHKWIQDAK
jgi:hypothetical protein